MHYKSLKRQEISGRVNREGEISNADLGKIVNLMQLVFPRSEFQEMFKTLLYSSSEVTHMPWLSDSGNFLQYLPRLCAL